jgi:lysophospholipase L1-like esterase
MLLDLKKSNINIVFDGNSLTAGVGATLTQDFPTTVKNWLTQNAKSVSFLSYGVGGQNLQTMVTNAPTKTYNKIATNKINILVLNEDANGLLTTYTTQQNIDLMNQYIDGAYSAGYDYVISWNGYYPRLPYDLFNPTTTQLNRQHDYFEQVNNGALRSDFNVDMRLAPKIGGMSRTQNQDKRYFNDYLHIREEGYKILANEIITKGLSKIFKI